jgi:hypothetical protein
MWFWLTGSGWKIHLFGCRQTTDLPNRSHIDESRSRYQLRSLQIILQATHGVVSGAPYFFKRAFGTDEAAFHDLLLWPHKSLLTAIGTRNWGDRASSMSSNQRFRE